MFYFCFMQELINQAWENREMLKDPAVQKTIRQVIDEIDKGQLRVAEPSAEGWKVNNVDATLILEKPRIKPFVDEMKKVLAGILQVDESAVSVKATTNESLGYVGREEGLLAFASALIIGD